MTSPRTVQCIYVEGFDECAFLHSGLDAAMNAMQASGFGPEFVVWRKAEKKERRLSYKRAKSDLVSLISVSQATQIFSVGINGNRDTFFPFSYIIINKNFGINRFLLYFPSMSQDPLSVLESIFDGNLCNGYIYRDDVLDSPPAFFAGVDYVGELGEANKPVFKDRYRIANWSGNLWSGIDPRLGYVTEIFDINIWSDVTLQFPLGTGTVRSYLEQNPIGHIGSSCGKFLIQLTEAEQQELRRVFDAAKICLAGFDGMPPIDLERPHRADRISH